MTTADETTAEPPLSLGAPHPRTIGWIGTSALAMGGSNQSLFILGALFVGQGTIAGQGSAAVPLLFLGVLLAWAAAPGWTELVLLRPNRVGGIAAACCDAFRPYSPILSALTGCCYWWGWVPTCGITAILSASALHEWLWPAIPTSVLAVAIVCFFTAVNLGGIRFVVRLAIPIAVVSGGAAFLSAFIPIVTGHVDWHQATTFHLTTPFSGLFGSLTSFMAGLYLVGFAAPAFEAAACHVGETTDPQRNVPRAMFVSAATAGMYFIVLPVVWLGVLGPAALGRDLATELGPTFAPLFGSLGKALAIGFMTFNMFHGTLQPLAGASRTLSQLADEAVLPRFLGLRSKSDTPWAATLLTAAAAIAFLFVGDPIWLIAAANFTYLTAISLASVAVWLLRRDAPQLERPYRAPRGTIGLGLAAAAIWGLSAAFGFQQFGLPTVILGLVFAYSGAAMYGWRKLEDRHRAREPAITQSLQLELTGLMVTVLLFDGVGYFMAIQHMPTADAAMVATLQDIFVVVAVLTIGVGLILPSMVAQAATHDLAAINASLLRRTEALRMEVCERELAQQRLLYAVNHDELTGLANRTSFMDRFNHMIALMQRRNDHLAAVLFLDLDRFKLVNDSLGHFAGDMLLIAVARRLERSLRPGDTLARLGGDEFAILLEDIHSERDATMFAERILAQLKLPFVVMERELFTSASIGIAITRTGFNTAEDVVRDADIAMYRAKELGKGRYEIFALEFFTRAVSLLNLQNDLQGALDRNEFVIFYQPIVALQSGTLEGFEALIRWQHPERGLLEPDEFIPAAEESGAILAIGAWVLEGACRQARIWEDAYGLNRSLAMSVNVSAKQFSNEALLDQIKSALATFRLSGAHLNIEITESAIMGSPEKVTETLIELRKMGIQVHLDDFGTGYSSLAYLRRFPVDTLKIDRSFVSASGTDGVRNPEIVKTITSLAQSLSMDTTAEGVETQAQFDQLRALNCTHAQGYFLSKPVDAAAAGAIIARRYLQTTPSSGAQALQSSLRVS